MNVQQWIEIDPLDTVFFKGSEPMVAGQNHEVKTMFPPMPSTVMGAIRTAILSQKGLMRDFIKLGKAPHAHAVIGSPEKPGFNLIGPIISVKTDNSKRNIFFPAPAIWFGDVKGLDDGQKVVIHTGHPIQTAIDAIGLKGSVSSPIWVKQTDRHDLKPLVGFWANRAAFSAIASGINALIIKNILNGINSETPILLSLSAIYNKEERVGIALDTKAGGRRVQKGHLYSTIHARLNADVTLLVGVSEKLAPDHLDCDGMFALGGEQRISCYHVLSESIDPPGKSGKWAMALSPFPYTHLDDWKLKDFPRVSGPLIRMGGWNMKEGFHKPMTAYLPAGTTIMFNKDVDLPFGFTRIQ